MIFYTTTSNGKKKVKLQWATIITMHHIRCYYCYFIIIIIIIIVIIVITVFCIFLT